MSFDLSAILGGSSGDAAATQDDGSSSGWGDALSAVGAQALAGAGQALGQIAQNYAKTYNPTTGAVQATSGTTPNGGPIAPNVVIPGQAATLWSLIKAHPIVSGLSGLVLLLGLGWGIKKLAGR